MSLTEVSLASVVIKQYKYKLKAYLGVFSSLVVLQILGVIFSFSGSGSMGTGAYGINVNISYYSADIVIFFTIIWGFISALLMTTRAYRDDDFVLITNRVSSNLSSIAFMLIASIAGGITAMLSGFLLKVLMYYVFGNNDILGTGLISDPLQFLMGTVATILLVFLFSALGYFAGVIVQLHRLFIVLLPALFFGFLTMPGKSGEGGIFLGLFEFFFQEASIFLFSGKVIVTTVLLFAGAILMSNQLEVKR